MAHQDARDGWPEQPVILEVNAWVWLDERSREHGRRVDLGTVAAPDWDAVLLPGVDAVWLMGVWTRSPAGGVIARTDAGVRRELESALDDLSDDDVVGSPYSVRSYSVDARLGGNEGLAKARAALGEREIKLLVDYVPNHVARDHAWATTRPDYFVHPAPADRERDPGHFVSIGDHHVALGRDPFFPPWTDVLQLNAFSPSLREATAATLTEIAGMADGVRCDMAMLLLNDVFARTWGHLAGPVPAQEFWAPIIAGVRRSAPDFLFVAEAYWDLEPQLLEQGFDYCYDKRLYDRVVAADLPGLRAHLSADLDYQRRMVRFLENHDEPRSAVTLPPERRRSAAVAIATLPGALLLYEGQAEGRTQRPPVQLGRRPVEPVDVETRDFYQRLLAAIDGDDLRAGTWTLLPVERVGGSADGLLAWAWDGGSAQHLVVVNLAGERCDGRIRLPGDRAAAGPLVVREVLDDRTYDHDAAEVEQLGLFVSLAAHDFHLLRLDV